jgi:hypothetical protein
VFQQLVIEQWARVRVKEKHCFGISTILLLRTSNWTRLLNGLRLGSSNCLKVDRIWTVVGMGIHIWNYIQKKDGVLYVHYVLKLSPIKEW